MIQRWLRPSSFFRQMERGARRAAPSPSFGASIHAASLWSIQFMVEDSNFLSFTVRESDQGNTLDLVYLRVAAYVASLSFYDLTIYADLRLDGKNCIF